MKKQDLAVELYEYPGDDHDISGNFNLAMQRSVEFFDKYAKLFIFCLFCLPQYKYHDLDYQI